MNNKIVIVDVGCRWGFADKFTNNPNDFMIFGFDPDHEECERLNNSYNSNYISVIPMGLSSTSGEKVLYLTKEPACSSLYKPDPYLTSNYPAFHCEIEMGKTVVETTTLDQWVNAAELNYIDYLKIDTQGSELDILKGGEKILKTVRAIELEVEFNPMYIGQCLFHEVDEFLRRHGFMLWKFTEVTHYSKNKNAGHPIHTCDVRYDEFHTEKHKVYSGQIFWANAHYVRSDVTSLSVSVDQRQKDILLFKSIGMPDVLDVDCNWDATIYNAIGNNIQNAEDIDYIYKQAESKAQQAESKAQQAESKAQQAESKAQQAESALNAIYASHSWRITAPLRKFASFFK